MPSKVHLLFNLTEREREVLLLICKGDQDSKIAKELVISISTARHHVENILTKLRVKNRTEAAIKALQYGLPSTAKEGNQLTSTPKPSYDAGTFNLDMGNSLCLGINYRQ